MRRRSPRAAAVRPRRCALPPPAAGRSVGSPPPPTRSVDGNGDRAARTCIRTELQHRARPARAGNRCRPVRRIAASRPVRAHCRRWPTLRRGARQFQPPMPLVERFPVRRSSEDRPRKGRGVKRRIRRPIRPAVADRHPLCAPLRNHLTVGPPFAADRPPVGLHFVTVFDVTGCERRAASPYAVAPVLHRNAPFAAAPDEPLPPLRAVFDLENHLHAYSSFRIKSAVSARVNAISASGAIRICKPRTPALT